MKTFSYCNVKLCSQSSTNSSHSRENWTWTFRFCSFFLLPFFLSFFMHNSETVQHIQMICTPKDCSSIRDFVVFFCHNCMQAKISELRLQAHITVSFPCTILCILKCTTRKLKVIYESFSYQMTPLLLEISIFLVRAVCKIWLGSYESKHIS